LTKFAIMFFFLFYCCCATINMVNKDLHTYTVSLIRHISEQKK